MLSPSFFALYLFRCDLDKHGMLPPCEQAARICYMIHPRPNRTILQRFRTFSFPDFSLGLLKYPDHFLSRFSTAKYYFIVYCECWIDLCV